MEGGGRGGEGWVLLLLYFFFKWKDKQFSFFLKSTVT